MALTDCNSPGSAFDPLPVRAASYAAPADTLLARAPAVCAALMASGAVCLVLTAHAGGVTLKAGFAWAVLLLIGIVAMIRAHIRGLARTLRRMPQDEARSDLRLLLFYMGAAWGAGSYLLMPDAPAPALVLFFAIGPSLAVALALKDRASTLAFMTPLTCWVAGAALLGAWPMDKLVAATVLTFGLGVVCIPALRHRHQAAI